MNSAEVGKGEMKDCNLNVKRTRHAMAFACSAVRGKRMKSVVPASLLR